MRSTFGRPGIMLVVLLGFLLATSTVAYPAPVAAGAVCDVKLSLTDGPEVDDGLTVREWEGFVVHGYGFTPSTPVTIRFLRTDAQNVEFDSVADASGSFAEAFFFESDELPHFEVGAIQGASQCPDFVHIFVIPGTPFTDVDGNRFEREIAWLYQSGITGGCTTTAFCPTARITREQMASFLVRALSLPAATADYFTDDETSVHEGDINRLAESGITGGCSPGRFCGKGLVTREQMASFLARGLPLPATSSDYFGDDETSVHEGDINRLAESGITGGCAAGKFCPKAFVTREQMAAFLFRALAE